MRLEISCELMFDHHGSNLMRPSRRSSAKTGKPADSIAGVHHGCWRHAAVSAISEVGDGAHQFGDVLEVLIDERAGAAQHDVLDADLGEASE